MNRLEKVDAKTVNDINNGNRNEKLRTDIIRNISKSFCINSIELLDVLDNNDFIFNDDLGNCGTTMDDDVFLEKEREFSCVSSYPASPAPSSASKDQSFTFDKVEARNSVDDGESKKSGAEEGKKEAGKIGRSRRASDVIDSIGDDCVNLRRPLETGGIAIATSRHRTSSDLGYSGSLTSSSPAMSFSYPPHMYTVGGGGGGKAGGGKDMPDAEPFTSNVYEGDFRSEVPEAVMPVERDAEEYNMYHPRRGRAIIINNDTFDNNLANPRKGSHVDVENLQKEFSNLGFEVTVYGNLTFHQIKEAICELSQEDHSDADCLMIAVLTHGMDNGWLYARDTLYPVEALWLPFTADKCLTLAGKPKIFFIQACRGSKVDPGVTLVNRKGSVSETDAGTAAYKLPSHSDFLIAYSSPDGFYSWRNTEDGTWFIQSLVEELKKNGSRINFLDILTRVNRRVAVHFSSYNEQAPWLHERKQVSTFQSTLIRDLIFRPKI